MHLCADFHAGSSKEYLIFFLLYLNFRHLTNGAVIARCSQPRVGWFGWRSEEDEALLQAIGIACAMSDKRKSTNNDKEKLNSSTAEADGISFPHEDVISERGQEGAGRQVLIVDARSYTAAVANRAKGGGCECSGIVVFNTVIHLIFNHIFQIGV